MQGMVANRCGRRILLLQFTKFQGGLWIYHRSRMSGDYCDDKRFRVCDLEKLPNVFESRKSMDFASISVGVGDRMWHRSGQCLLSLKRKSRCY